MSSVAVDHVHEFKAESRWLAGPQTGAVKLPIGRAHLGPIFRTGEALRVQGAEGQQCK